MKKKLLILPVALFALTLGACKGFSDSKEPKFEKYENKVEVDKFAEDFSDDAFVKRISALDFKVSDYALKQTKFEKQEMKEASSDDKKATVYESYLQKEKSSLELAYDKDNTFISEKISNQTYLEGTSAVGEKATQKIDISSKSELLFLEAKVDDAESIVGIEKATKTYWVASLVSEYDSIEIAANSRFTEGFGTIMGILLAYEGATEEEKKDYSFYSDARVFTVVYENEEKQEYKDSDDKVYATMTTKTSGKVQIIFADTSYDVRYSTTQSSKMTYIQEHNYTPKGTVATMDTVDYRTFKAEEKDQSLSAPEYRTYLRITSSVEP